MTDKNNAPDSAAQPDTTASTSEDVFGSQRWSKEAEMLSSWTAAQPVQAGEAVALPQQFDEQAGFETWARATNQGFESLKGTRDPSGTWYYFDDEPNIAWSAWQYRASLAPVSAQQGAAEQHNAVECDSALRAEPASQHEAWTTAAEKVSNALTLAMTICDAVPTRAHDLAEDEDLKRLGRLVNCDVGTGQHGYALIRDAQAAFAEVLATRCRPPRGNTCIGCEGKPAAGNNPCAVCGSNRAACAHDFTNAGKGWPSVCLKCGVGRAAKAPAAQAVDARAEIFERSYDMALERLTVACKFIPMHLRDEFEQEWVNRRAELYAASPPSAPEAEQADADVAKDALTEHIAMIKESGWAPADGSISAEELMRIGRKWMRGREEHRGANDFMFTRTKFLKMVREAIDVAMAASHTEGDQ